MMRKKNRMVALGALLGAACFLAAAGRASADPVKCQQAIAKASSKYVQDKTKALSKCEQSKVKGKLPAATNCAADAKTAATIAKAASKVAGAIDKACGGADKLCGTGGDDDSLASIGWPSQCPTLETSGACGGAIVHCGDVADCLTCLDDAAVTQASQLYYANLVPDTVANKALNKCQQTIGAAAEKFLAAKSKALQGCWDQRLKGKHTDVCPNPAADPKSPAGKAAAAIAKAEQKKIDAICKACGGADKACGGGDDLAPAAIGFVDDCTDVTVPGGMDCGAILEIDTVSEVVACVDCVTEFKVDCVDRAAVPGLAAYPSECGAPVAPTPTPTPGPTPTPTPPPGCSTATVKITTSYVAPPGDPVAGVTTALNYPEGKVGIPGVGSEASVTSRVSNQTGVSGLFNVGDDDSILNVGLVAIGPNIPPGDFANAVFDCVSGTPVAGDFACVAEISTLNGNSVSGTCAVTVMTAP